MSESIFNALKELDSQNKILSVQKQGRFWNSIEGKMYIAVMGMMAAALILATINYFVSSSIIKFSTLLLIILAYLSLALIPVILIYHYKKAILGYIKNPAITYIDDAYKTVKIRQDCFHSLKDSKIIDLKFALNNLKETRSQLETRTSLIVGNIKAIGLLPGLVGLFISVNQFSDIKYDWVLMVTATIGFLYIVAFIINLIVLKLDSYITLLELVVEDNKVN